MEKISNQSKGQSKCLSPSRSASTSIKLSRASSVKFEVDHLSPKSPSDNLTILFPKFHQDSPEV